jgi:phosphomethylpyrimidine synthase
MKITQEVRDFAAKQNQESDAFIAAEDAEAGMEEMSKVFKEKGGEVYLPAAE